LSRKKKKKKKEKTSPSWKGKILTPERGNDIPPILKRQKEGSKDKRGKVANRIIFSLPL